MTKLGFIGTGHLAGYFLEGLKRVDAPYEITVSPRNAQKARELQQRFGVAIASNQDIVDSSDLVVVSVLPQQASSVLEGLQFRAGQTVLSVMAGVTLDRLIRMVRPASCAISMMTGAANAWNIGPSVLHPDEPAAREMLGYLGPVHTYEDGRAFTAASVMGAFSGMSILLMRDAANWFSANGLSPEDSSKLVAEILGSNASMLVQAPETMDGVVTPGGITEQGRKILDSGGTWAQALDAVLKRVSPKELT